MYTGRAYKIPKLQGGPLSQVNFSFSGRCMGMAKPCRMNIYQALIYVYQMCFKTFQSSTRVALTCMGAVTNNPLLSTTAPFRQVNDVLFWKIINKNLQVSQKYFVR